MSRTALGVKTKRGSRTFHITIQPVNDDFGLTLVESDVKSGFEAVVASANATRTREIASAVHRALRDSGHNRTTLTARRKSAITLDEDAGVRLALTLFATQGVKKGRRKMRMITAIDSMATEEAYYWYAKCVGQERPRAQRALRLLLAEE